MPAWLRACVPACLPTENFNDYQITIYKVRISIVQYLCVFLFLCIQGITGARKYPIIDYQLIPIETNFLHSVNIPLLEKIENIWENIKNSTNVQLEINWLISGGETANNQKLAVLQLKIPTFTEESLVKGVADLSTGYHFRKTMRLLISKIS